MNSAATAVPRRIRGVRHSLMRGLIAAKTDYAASLGAARPGRAVMASVPIPKFANTRGTLSCELRNQRDTSNSMILVPLLNPKFAIGLAARVCELRVRGTRAHSVSMETECALFFERSHFRTENRFPPRIKSGAGIFLKML